MTAREFTSEEPMEPVDLADKHVLADEIEDGKYNGDPCFIAGEIRELCAEVETLRRRVAELEGASVLPCPCGGYLEAGVGASDYVPATSNEWCGCTLAGRKVHTACAGHCAEARARAEKRKAGKR